MGQDSRERGEARAGGDRLLGRPLDQGPGLPHPSSAGSPGLGRAPGGRQCHCWGPRPHVPSCRGGFRKARSGLARGVDTQIPRGVWAGPASRARGAWLEMPGAGPSPRDSPGSTAPRMIPRTLEEFRSSRRLWTLTFTWLGEPRGRPEAWPCPLPLPTQCRGN